MFAVNFTNTYQFIKHALDKIKNANLPNKIFVLKLIILHDNFICNAVKYLQYANYY